MATVEDRKGSMPRWLAALLCLVSLVFVLLALAAPWQRSFSRGVRLLVVVYSLPSFFTAFQTGLRLLRPSLAAQQTAMLSATARQWLVRLAILSGIVGGAGMVLAQLHAHHHAVWVPDRVADDMRFVGYEFVMAGVALADRAGAFPRTKVAPRGSF